MFSSGETSSTAPDAPGSVVFVRPELGQQELGTLVRMNPYGGPFEAIPAASTNGTMLPSGPNGVRIHLGSAGTFTYTKAVLQPTGAPSMVETLTGSTAKTFFEIYVNPYLANVYVTAFSGGVFYEPF